MRSTNKTHVKHFHTIPTFDVERLPEPMRSLPGWIYWIDVDQNPKLPRTVRGPHNFTDPACLANLDEVLEKTRHYKIRHGIGFSFLKEFNLSYIDLDDCLHNGEITPYAAGIVERLNSYTEISIGGNGLHIVVRGTVEKTQMHTSASKGKERIEIVPSKKWMSVSGNVLGSLSTIESRQSELSALYEETFAYREKPYIATITREKPTKPDRQTNRLDMSNEDYRQCCVLINQGKTAQEICEILRNDPLFGMKRKPCDLLSYRTRTLAKAFFKEKGYVPDYLSGWKF